MRCVRIEIIGTGLQARLLETEYKTLETFVQAAKEGGCLRELAVQWIQRSPPLQCAPAVSWHFHPVERDRGLERNGEGGRGLILSTEEAADYDEDYLGTMYMGVESELEEWKADEVVLRPLRRLRGLARGMIEGTVTEKWALWLERAVTAQEGDVIPLFEFSPEAKETLGRFSEERY